MTPNSKPQVILDTSPLITLCSFVAQGELIIDSVLSFVDILVVDTVAQECTANQNYADARTIQKLIDKNQIITLRVPQTGIDILIDNYTKLGHGERDTLRLAITLPDLQIVLDDFLAYIVASRFDTNPILLLDLLVQWVESGYLESGFAHEMVNTIAPRYSPPFIEHTRQKLRG